MSEAPGAPAVVAARRWLDQRLDEAPPRLGEAVRAALDGLAADEDGAEDQSAVGSGDGKAGAVSGGYEYDGPWDVMARAAVRELEAVRPEAGDREAAAHLLAADALLTYAFQCAAEEGADLKGVADRWGAGGGLGEALERARRAVAGGDA